VTNPTSFGISGSFLANLRHRGTKNTEDIKEVSSFLILVSLVSLVPLW
jgi:hypothetical protein